MNLLVLDEDFQSIGVVDSYESLIWTDRYREAGDFELYVAATRENLALFKQNYYLWFVESDHVMIIESNEVNTNSEEGCHLTVTGRSLESMLDRRIVWTLTNLNGDFQNGVKTILENAIINPSDSTRKIDNFVFQETEDTKITEMTIDAQYTGDNIYDILVTQCEDRDIGFKIVLDEDNKFVFSLYNGVDHSYDQETLPYVVFSPKFENIINTNYLESYKTMKNVTLVAGEGEGTDRKTKEVRKTEDTGLLRREMYTDARDISSKDNDVQLSDTEYYAKLQTRGEEDLSDNKKIKTFEGKVEATQLFKYKQDFDIGDIVQITNEYGIEGKARVTEMVWSQSKTGVEIYPNFEAIEEDNE